MADEKVLGSAADSPPADGDKPELKADDDFTLPEDVKDEKSRARFQKLADRVKASEEALAGYKEYGDPKAIAEFVQDYRAMAEDHQRLTARIATMEERRDPGEPKTDAQKEAEAKAAAIRKELRQVDPTLDRMEKFLERSEAKEKMETELLTQDAIEDTAKVMKEFGYGTSREEVLEMCDLLEPIIRRDARLAYRFKRDPEKAIRPALERLMEKSRTALDGRAKAEAQVAKEKLKGLPRPHGGGGSPPGRQDQKPAQSVSEGVTRALGRWAEKVS